MSTTTRNLYALSAVFVVLGVVQFYLFHQLSGLVEESARMRNSVVAEVNRIRARMLAANDAGHQQLEDLRGEVQAAREEVTASAAAAKIAAQNRAAQLARRLAAARRRHQRQVAGELTNIRAISVTARAAAGDLSGDVAAVKAETTAAKSKLSVTAADVEHAQAGPGELRGRVATNSRELAALRALGDRNYVEFHLNKRAGAQRVGDVTITLRKTDRRHGRYTVELVFGGRKLEQKNRTLNEPVRFLPAGSRRACELVVNRIGKDEIAGYLASPKPTQFARK